MNIEPKSTKTCEQMLKNMKKPDFTAKNSKKFTRIMHFKIENFGKVVKISHCGKVSTFDRNIYPCFEVQK